MSVILPLRHCILTTITVCLVPASPLSPMCSYGPNVFPEPPFSGFWALFIEAFQDPILMILIAAAVVSFAVGIAEDPHEGWIDGVSIVIAILLVAFVGAGVWLDVHVDACYLCVLV